LVLHLIVYWQPQTSNLNPQTSNPKPPTFQVKFLKSKHKNNQSDEALIAGYVASSDPQCIEILFDRYCHLLVAVAMNYLQDEEESKDTVLEIFEKIPSDLKRYQIKDFSKWIYVVTKNHCYHRRKKLRHEKPEALLPPVADPEFTGESTGETDILMEHLDESIAALPPKQITCIRLFYLEEKSYEEIERLTGFSYNEVKSHIQNGKRNMKNFLSRYRK